MKKLKKIKYLKNKAKKVYIFKKTKSEFFLSKIIKIYFSPNLFFYCTKRELLTIKVQQVLLF